MEIIKSEVIKKCKGYEVRKEVWKSFPGAKGTVMISCYTPKGEWIGGEKEAEYLCDEKGIAPEKRNPNHCVCSIGFSKKEQKWYGWSHRAIYGFGIGDTIKKGSCGYRENKGEWTAKTLNDAKQMAIDFADSVS